MITIFRGEAREDGPVAWVEVNGERRKLSPRYDLRNHSPDGFAWGYNGSGPAQLALAILAKQYGAKVALGRYQDFKAGVIARLDMNSDWVLTTDEIEEWMRR